MKVDTTIEYLLNLLRKFKFLEGVTIMLKTYEAIYDNQTIIFLDEIPTIKRAKVFLTVLDEINKPMKKSITQYAGVLSKDDADLMINAINQNCEQINQEDWK